MKKPRFAPYELIVIAKNDLFKILEAHGPIFVLSILTEYLMEQDAARKKAATADDRPADAGSGEAKP